MSSADAPGAQVAPGERDSVSLLARPRPRALCRTRSLLVAGIAWILFAGHWARDSVGALELPLEAPAAAGGFNLTAREYNGLSAVFFLPNLPAPLLAGGLAQQVGPGPVYVAFLAFALAGNACVARAAVVASRASLGWLTAGRFLMGVSYEAADMLPIGLLSPHFAADGWATVVGLINGSNRLGSVCNFLILPVVLHRAGLTAALLLASGIGACTFFCGVAVYRLDARQRARDATRRRELEASGARAEAASAPPLSLRSLRSFSGAYWWYLAGCVCVYGAVVPFWFIGAKHIALRWRLSVAAADAYLLWPEGAIAVIAPPFGYWIDRRAWPLRTRLFAAAAAMLPIALALVALGRLALPPMVGVGLLGIGYACAQNLVWCTITMVSPPGLINLSSGLVGCSVNLLPMLLPACVFVGDGEYDVTVLGGVATFGALAFAVSGVLAARMKLKEVACASPTGADTHAASTSSTDTEIPKAV
jgi:MFS family permease